MTGCFLFILDHTDAAVVERVVLVAKGKIANYYFGIIQTGLYAYIAYGYGLYGEVMLNGLFYFPLQFVGIYLWSRHTVKSDARGEDVVVHSLSKAGWMWTRRLPWLVHLLKLEGAWHWDEPVTMVSR